MNFKITRISALQIFQLMRFATLMAIGIVFTKSGLSTGEIGQYETFLFIAGAITFFWLNGIIQGFLPSSNEHLGDTKTPGLFNIFYLLTIFSVLSAVFILIFEHSISGFLLKNSPVPFLHYLLLYLVISSPASLVEYIYLISDKGKQMIVYGLVSFFLMFVLVIAPPVFGLGIGYSIAGLIVSAAFRMIWLLVLLFRNSSPVFQPGFILNHLNQASPVIFSLLLSGSAQYIDGFIITAYFDEATFAVFRYGAREFPLVMLLANAFSSSMLPAFGEPAQLEANLEKIRNSAQQMGKWLFPASALMMLISHPVFPVVFNANFAASATIFNIYLLLIVSRLLFPQTILIGLRKTRPVLWASFFEIIVNVAFSLWFVRFWGLSGVAFGTVIAYIFEKVFLAVSVRKNFGFSLPSYLNLKQHLLYSLFLGLEFVIVEFLA